MRQQRYLPIVILLLVMWGLLTLRADALWFGQHEENGRWISSAARNYVLYGADNLNYLVTPNAAPTDIDELEIYVHHPPLVVWLVSLSSDVFGRYGDESLFVNGTPKEFAARLVPLFATMISLSAFYVTVRRLYPHLAFMTLFLYAFTPMIAYFGRMVNHEPLALAFLYLFMAVYLNWMRHYTHRRTLALIVLAGLAVWSAWAVLFFFGAIGVVTLIYGGRQQRIGIVGIGFTTALFTGAIIGYYALAHADTFHKLAEAFSFRTSNQSQSRGSESFTLGAFVVRQLVHSLTAMSFGIVFLGAWGLIKTLRGTKHLAEAVVLAMCVGALGYMLVFRNAFYIHDYYKIYFMPSFAIGTALVIHQARTIRQRGWGRYARQFVYAVIFWSLLIGGYWFYILHRSGMDEFPLQIIDAIIENTEPDAKIFTNLESGIPSFEYYTYRSITREPSINNALTHATSSGTPIWYLLCPSSGQNIIVDYDGLLSDNDFVEVADLCRLIPVN